MEKTGSQELKALTEWSSNVMSVWDYSLLTGIASVVHEMTHEGEHLVYPFIQDIYACFFDARAVITGEAKDL